MKTLFLVKIRTMRYQESIRVTPKMILTKNWGFWQSSPKNFWILKILGVCRKCVNLWRVNLLRKTVWNQVKLRNIESSLMNFSSDAPSLQVHVFISQFQLFILLKIMNLKIHILYKTSANIQHAVLNRGTGRKSGQF